MVTTGAQVSASVFPTHHLNTNEKGKKVMTTTSAAEFSALPTAGEAQPSGNVSYHQGHPQTRGYSPPNEWLEHGENKG
jgi:hypothetical protein